MEPKITITAKLLDKKTGKPLNAAGTIVKLFDKDIFEDDFLGQSKINDDGSVHITFTASDFSSADSPGEKHPDLYFTVYKYGKLLYKSKILKNFDLELYADSKPFQGSTIDLGTFAIEES